MRHPEGDEPRGREGGGARGGLSANESDSDGHVDHRSGKHFEVELPYDDDKTVMLWRYTCLWLVLSGVGYHLCACFPLGHASNQVCSNYSGIRQSYL